MSDDPATIVREIMSSSLTRVIDFLKFAEAKNAAILTLSSAWIIAILNLLSGDKVFPAVIRETLILALPCFIIAAIISVFSFIPRINLNQFLKSREREKNLLFFGDIADIDCKELGSHMEERYFTDTGSLSPNYFSDLAVQISVNSCILNRKFKFFKYSVWAILGGITLIIVPSSICLFGNC